MLTPGWQMWMVLIKLILTQTLSTSTALDVIQQALQCHKNATEMHERMGYIEGLARTTGGIEVSTVQPGKIQVSDAFANALSKGVSPTLDGADVVILCDPFFLRLRGSIEIKGKGEMKTWWLEPIGT